jgi:hypothetical protein
MRILVDVYDALGNRLGSGPALSAVSTSVKRALDGAGTVKLEFPATDPRVLDLIQNERRVRIYVENDDVIRELGRGVIRTLRVNVTESSITLSAEGPDSLDALTRRSVLLNRQFTNQSISTIASSLVSLVPGWLPVVESAVASDLQTARFDGVSVLKALIRVCEEKGIHLREGVDANTVELGEFGSQSNIVISNIGSIAREVHSNNEVILIDRLTVTQDSEAVANWIVPVGAGEGQAALTLKNSNRNSPFPIQTLVGADGQTLYYLKDDASIAANDQLEKIVTFKSIAPLNNSDTAKRLAANALYDAAAAWLERNNQRQTTYQVTGVKARQQVRPGDKIRLVYKGVVYQDNVPAAPLTVDDYFWVLSVTEKISDTGMSIDLEISSVDKQAQDAAQIVVGALEAIDVRNVAVQTAAIYYENTYIDTVGSNATVNDKPARFLLKIPNLLTDLIQVKLSFVTRPLWTPTLVSTVPSPIAYNWAVVEGYNYPSDVSLWVNGVDVSASLGGPWNVGGINAALDIQDLDITQYILDAVGGIYQGHRVEVQCLGRVGEVRLNTGYPSVVTSTASNGLVQLTFNVLGVGQAILPT